MVVHIDGRTSIKCDKCAKIVFDYPTLGFIQFAEKNLFICSTCLLPPSVNKVEYDRVAGYKKWYIDNREYALFKSRGRRMIQKKVKF